MLNMEILTKRNGGKSKSCDTLAHFPVYLAHFPVYSKLLKTQYEPYFLCIFSISKWY